MSSVDTEAAVLLGVGGRDRLSDGTIAFVVETAERLGLGVELVHAVPAVLGGPTGAWEVGIAFGQLVSEGEARLEEAATRVRSRLGSKQPVTTQLVRGGAVGTLVDRSRSAQLVVLERRHLGRWERLAEGSITAGVAARAHAPVVSVPRGWRPPQQPRPITVAVEDAARADAEVWTALGLAAAEDLPVQILRVVYLPEAYQEILRRETPEQDLLRLAHDELVRDTNLPDSICDRVPCTFTVRWGRPAEVLVDASAASSMLVVARRDPRLPFGSHLGPIVRHVLDHATCPVMVVEPRLAEDLTAAESFDDVLSGRAAARLVFEF
ncbi:universal stress protein [Nocardioides halotolerans]|uniref:universal stress protein n=1 Tax=Nocardioides halotolerans TaxID=433660 RepID=UPI00049040CE|nr:universal stress protein [Nocardioides halotolerans]